MNDVWLWRPIGGGIREAIEHMRLFRSKDEMMNFVYDLHQECSRGDLDIELYSKGRDDRILWNKTYLIFNKQTNTACGGFCTNDFDEELLKGIEL